MKIMRPVALAALTASLATPALADRQETIYLNPFAGFQLFDDKRDLSETGTFGVGVEYRFLPRWSVEAVYSRADADRKYVAGESEFQELRIDGTYYFAGPDAAWNPYVSLGAGHAEFGVGDTISYTTAGTDHEETRVNVGVGFRYNVSDSISIRGDLREFHGIDESTFDTMASLGLSWAFTRTVASSKPAPAPEPAPAPAPADSDGDGVPDNRDQCPNTPAGVQVDSRGCPVDSDGDGVPDYRDDCPNTAAGATVDERGCEGVTETVETIELRVQFPTNSSVIDATFDNEIRRVADFMAEYPETTVEIAGHSDSIGDAEYNRFLSQRRAEAVANRLTTVLGVDPDRVSAMGYGEAEPIASNDTAAGRAQNRRVEARIQVSR
ncbi:OmpA family protein [Marinobacter shengliensis]|uniref:OmpA family protein n=1 Tax=Marinobacter shengliensis TaxID=1389223 RepID=UPI001E2E766A|nr:OmpA family protein [Marinobacter shengliensis]MCD1628624.1 OmpA family protein [Marinobacter shengliensis]